MLHCVVFTLTLPLLNLACCSCCCQNRRIYLTHSVHVMVGNEAAAGVRLEAAFCNFVCCFDSFLYCCVLFRRGAELMMLAPLASLSPILNFHCCSSSLRLAGCWLTSGLFSTPNVSLLFNSKTSGGVTSRCTNDQPSIRSVRFSTFARASSNICLFYSSVQLKFSYCRVNCSIV